MDTIVIKPNRGRLTANDDILRRLLLPFDSDPERPTGMAATEEQRTLAFQQSERIQQTLLALGWPEPAIVSTGNGVHRYFACAGGHSLRRGADWETIQRRNLHDYDALHLRLN